MNIDEERINLTIRIRIGIMPVIKAIIYRGDKYITASAAEKVHLSTDLISHSLNQCVMHPFN